MTRLAVLLLLAFAGCGGGSAAAPAERAAAGCQAAGVHHEPYPGGDETPCVKPGSGCRLAVKRCALCPAGSLR